jgi:hypothetical protein
MRPPLPTYGGRGLTERWHPSSPSAEIAMRIPPGAGVRCDGEHLFQRRVVHGIVQAGEHPSRITERRVCRDILDALAIEQDFAPIA